MKKHALEIGSASGWYGQLDMPRCDDPMRCYRVLVVDLVGLEFDARGVPDCSAFASHVQARGASFWPGERYLSDSSRTTQGALDELLKTPGIVFEYHPELGREQDLLELTADGQFDAIIAAATKVPVGGRFVEGGVRIGAGTANMASQSFSSGAAPLMNTPGFNSRATAQMVFKALLRVRPDLPFEQLHELVGEGRFDTSQNLSEFPTHNLDGRRIAILGYGNIGREVALIAKAFGMQVAVYARPALRPWIEAEGHEFCATVVQAATGAQVLSPHLGLGPKTSSGFANAGVIDATIFDVLGKDAVLINFDRGELIKVDDLRVALDTGQLSSVAVDADIFAEADKLSGPLVPYLDLLSKHEPRVLLLPHAAADTDHPSRVAGALQAVDQILAAIRYRCVVNAVGRVPDAYTDLGSQGVLGVGRVSNAALEALQQDESEVASLRIQLAAIDRWLEELLVDKNDRDPNPDTRAALLALNRVASKARELGLLGPGPAL